jgi:hypothetical protein
MRVRIGGAVGLVAAILVACSGDDQPSTLPDATPTNADSAASEVVNPASSGNPTAQLEAEINEFLNTYAQAINESWVSSDALARRRQMFADSCVSCLAGYKLAERAQGDGLQLERGKASLRDLRVDRVEGDLVTVSAFTDSEEGRLIDSADNVVQEFDASSNVQIVYQLRPSSSNNWIIVSGEVLG